MTFHTEGAHCADWFPDGNELLLRASRDHDWRAAHRLFRRGLQPDDQEHLLFDAEIGVARLAPKGTSLAYTREGSRLFRKGYYGPQASQVWLYDMEAGTHTRVTDHNRGDRYPTWGPDASSLYVVSQFDNPHVFDLARIDLATKTRTRLTRFERDGALTFSLARDGSRAVLRRGMDLVRVELTGPAGAEPAVHPVPLIYRGPPLIDPVERKLSTRGTAAAFTDDAREIALIVEGDLYVMDTKLKEPVRVTGTAVAEDEPVFTPDHERLYFTSSAGGQVDIWVAQRMDRDKAWWQNTEFKVEPVTRDEAIEHSLELTTSGKRLAYLQGTGNLWTRDLEGGDPQQHLDGWDQPDWSFSPDDRWLAYAVDDADFNRDVWIRPIGDHGDDAPPPFNLSRHPDRDANPVWSPDGTKIAFVGRRWGEDSDIVYVHLQREQDEETERDRRLEEALKEMKARKKKGKKAARKKTPTPKIKPAPTKPAKEPSQDDPKATSETLGGTWQGQLKGDPPLPPEGFPITVVFSKSEAGAWKGTLSIPGQMEAAFQTLTVSEDETEISFTSTTPLGPLAGKGTRAGTSLEGTWTIGETMKGTFELTRQTPEQDAPDDDPKKAPSKAPTKAPKGDKKDKEGDKQSELESVEIDWEGLEDRLRRISLPALEEGSLLWSPDSKKLGFSGREGRKTGFYTVSWPKPKEPKRLTTRVGQGARWLKEGKRIVWLAAGRPERIASSGKAESFSFRLRTEVHLGHFHASLVDEAWRLMHLHYYDPSFGGQDWDALRKVYVAAARDAMTPGEVNQVANMMLGELNGSHLGFNYRAPSWRPKGWQPVTGHLGLSFEREAGGPGLVIAEILKDSPAYRESAGLKPGMRVLSIDGKRLTATSPVAAWLTGDLNRDVRLRVREGDEAPRTVFLRPTTYAGIRALRYEAWLASMRKRVDEASEGQLGYLHVRGMNWQSFERFEKELYKVGAGKSGLLIDVRNNGGGFTTDHLLTCLTQPEHAVTIPRGGEPGYPQGRMVYARWTKPIVVLCNQNSFSNAEIFSHAIKSLKRGRVVGVQTAGGVISTGGTTLRGVASLRLPFRGWYLADTGEDMELNGCKPDIEVDLGPADEASGGDPQLQAAIKALLEDVAADEAKARPTYKIRKRRR